MKKWNGMNEHWPKGFAGNLDFSLRESRWVSTQRQGCRCLCACPRFPLLMLCHHDTADPALNLLALAMRSSCTRVFASCVGALFTSSLVYCCFDGLVKVRVLSLLWAGGGGLEVSRLRGITSTNHLDISLGYITWIYHFDISLRYITSTHHFGATL